MIYSSIFIFNKKDTLHTTKYVLLKVVINLFLFEKQIKKQHTLMHCLTFHNGGAEGIETLSKDGPSITSTV